MSHNAMTRELPHDLDAEKAVLGSILIDASSFPEALLILRGGAAEFFSEKHAEFWTTVATMHREGKPFDGMVIRDELQRRNRFDRIGGYDFLGELTGSVPSSLRIAHYAGIVHRHYLRRLLVNAAWRQSEAAFADNCDVPTAVREATAALTQVSEQSVATQALAPNVEFLESVYAGLEVIEGDDMQRGIRTGIYELDKLTSEFKRGQLVIVGGRPSRGKSALVLQIAARAATDENLNVLMFSTEMTRTQITKRILANVARVDYGRIQRPRELTSEDREKLSGAKDYIARAALTIDDTAAVRTSQIVARTRTAHAKQPLDLVVVDHCHEVTVDGEFDSEPLRRGEVARVCKALAKDLQVPVILAAQLNRGPEDRPDKRPTLGDFKWSGDLEAVADIAIFPHQFHTALSLGVDDKPDTIRTGPAVIIVAKNRDGETGTVQVFWSGHYQRFDPLAPTHHGEQAGDPTQFADGAYTR